MIKSGGGHQSVSSLGSHYQPLHLASPQRSSLILPSSSPEDDVIVPKLLSNTIILELYRFQDVFSSRRFEEASSNGLEIRVPAHVSLKWLRKYVLESTAKEDDTQSDGFSPEKPLESNALSSSDVELRYFNIEVNAWRILSASVDWTTAKLTALERNEKLKIIYALGKEEEIAEAVRRTKKALRKPISKSQSDFPFDDSLTLTSGNDSSERTIRDVFSSPLPTHIAPYRPKLRKLNGVSGTSQQKQIILGHVLEQRLMKYRKK